MRDHALSAVASLVRVFVGQLAYRARRRLETLQGQGTLRRSDAAVWAFKKEIWESISDVLLSVRAKDGLDKSKSAPFGFLGGDGPGEIDATLFRFIVSVSLCTA